MSKFPKPEEIMSKYATILTDGTKVYAHPSRIRAMKEYGRQIRDKTLEWAAENGKAYYSYSYVQGHEAHLNKQSVLNGKTSKDLEI